MSMIKPCLPKVQSVKNNVLKIKQRGLRIDTWNFQHLCNDRKAIEIGEVLSKNHTDIASGQESRELDHSNYVPDYNWFGETRKGVKGKRGKGGVGFW